SGERRRPRHYKLLPACLRSSLACHAEALREGGSLITRLPRRSRGEGGSLLNPAAPFEQPRRFHPLCPGCECRRRTAPAQPLYIFEKWRVGAQGCEILEEQREIALFAENV